MKRFLLIALLPLAVSAQTYQDTVTTKCNATAEFAGMMWDWARQGTTRQATMNALSLDHEMRVLTNMVYDHHQGWTRAQAVEQGFAYCTQVTH